MFEPSPDFFALVAQRDLERKNKRAEALHFRDPFLMTRQMDGNMRLTLSIQFMPIPRDIADPPLITSASKAHVCVRVQRAGESLFVDSDGRDFYPLLVGVAPSGPEISQADRVFFEMGQNNPFPLNTVICYARHPMEASDE